MAEPASGWPALPAAPPRLVDDNGEPAFGLYAGSVDDARFGLLRTPPSLIDRRLVEKRWHYALVITEEIMLSFAIVDAGYLGSGICAVFDRGARRLLVDSNPVVPPLFADVNEEPADGHRSSIAGPMVRGRIERSGRRALLSADWANAKIELALDMRKAPTPMTAIARAGEGGRFDFTQKTVLVPVEGEIVAGNARFGVQDAVAALDYTHGMLPRETAWRWALGMAKEARVAFNFSEGFLQGQGENVVWIDGAPRAAGPVEFEAGGPEGPWKIHGDGVELTFQPEGARAQDIDLKLISSKYVQPYGVFSGRVLGVAVEGAPGVTEDHFARW